MKFNIKLVSSLLIIMFVLFVNFDAEFESRRTIHSSKNITSHLANTHLISKSHRLSFEICIQKLFFYYESSLIDLFDTSNRRVDLIGVSLYDHIIEKQGYFGSVWIR